MMGMEMDFLGRGGAAVVRIDDDFFFGLGADFWSRSSSSWSWSQVTVLDGRVTPHDMFSYWRGAAMSCRFFAAHDKA
jgi:hypothetical protein